MEKTKKNGRFYLALVIFCLTGQVAWTVENMYFNVFIYKMFHASAEAISAMVAASAVAATVTTLIIGALSDKIGKRKIFICGGYIAWGVSIWSFSLIRMDVISSWVPNLASAASVGVTLTIIMDCIMTFFGSSANDACFNAWLTDVSDDSNRGHIEGINSMMPLVSILVVFGGFMSFDLNLPQSWVTIFNIIGIAVIGIGISGIWLIRDVPIRTEENQNYFANIFYGFRPSVVKGNPDLYLTLMAVAVFNISIQIFMPYLILYYTVTLGMDNYVLIFAPAIVVAAAFTGLYGKVYDTRGIMALIPSMLPRLESSEISVSQALKQASLAEDPKKVITQSITMVSPTPKDAAAAALGIQLWITSIRSRLKLQMLRPQAIYPPQIKIFRFPILSDRAPMSSVVTVAATAEAATMAEIASALAWNIL